jgi:hypothetical protein
MQEAGTGGGDGGWLDSKLGAVKEERLAELRQEVSAKKREEAVVQDGIARDFCAMADYQKDVGREQGVDLGRERGSRKDLGRERGVEEVGGGRKQGMGMGNEQEREQGGGRGGRGRGAKSAEEEDELMGLDSEMLALQRSLERAARWLGWGARDGERGGGGRRRRRRRRGIAVRNVSRFYSQVAAVSQYTDYVFAAVLYVHLPVSPAVLSLFSLPLPPRPPSLSVLSLSLSSPPPPAPTPYGLSFLINSLFLFFSLAPSLPMTSHSFFGGIKNTRNTFAAH